LILNHVGTVTVCLRKELSRGQWSLSSPFPVCVIIFATNEPIKRTIMTYLLRGTHAKRNQIHSGGICPIKALSEQHL